MNKRLVIKTALICTGIFIILLSLLVLFVVKNYKFDTDKVYRVVVATTNIDQGSIINEAMITTKEIKGNAINNYLIQDQKQVIGTKALKKIYEGDYIRNFEIIRKEDFYKDDEKIITYTTESDTRLGNLIKKGSFVDIMVQTDLNTLPKRVLSKVLVSDIVDENGLPLNENSMNKKAFLKFVLNEQQRERLAAAQEIVLKTTQQQGKIYLELFGDESQPKAEETFIIPAEMQSSQTDLTNNITNNQTKR